MKKRIFVAAVLAAGAAVLAFSQFGVLRWPAGAQQGSPAQGSGIALAGETQVAAKPGPKSEAELLLEQGIKALQAGNAAKAQEAFAYVLKRFPSHPAGARAAREMAAIYTKSGDLISARDALSKALAGTPEGASRQEVVNELNRLNGEIVFSKKPGGGSIEYTVKRGDNLHNIGKQYRVTAEFIRRINYLTSDRINIGDRLKVFQGPFDVVIEKSRFRLTVYLNGLYVKEYRVGLGKDNSTPEGEYTVENKLVDPVWNPPGPEYAASKAPDNPLGTRWVGFEGEYGIHGTIEPQSIGKSESRGCIRLINADVEELYDMLVVGSKVTVLP